MAAWVNPSVQATHTVSLLRKDFSTWLPAPWQHLSAHLSDLSIHLSINPNQSESIVYQSFKYSFVYQLFHYIYIHPSLQLSIHDLIYRLIYGCIHLV